MEANEAMSLVFLLFFQAAQLPAEKKWSAMLVLTIC